MIKHWFTKQLKFDKGLNKPYYEIRYLCNRACGVTTEKLAVTPYLVTCKNCKKQLDKYLNKNQEG